MGRPISVVHVDDDPSITDLTATYLEREDDRFAIRTATSAAEGLNRIRNRPPDCIVSDYDMPGQNGIQFLQRVRDEWPDLPFILFTGKGSEEVASDALSNGATDYLQKGSGTDQYTILANRVQNAVQQDRSKEQAERMQRRLREVTESVGDCVWMFTRNWEELLFISGCEEVWGRTIEELTEIPRDFLEIVHPADRDFVRESMETVSSGEPIDIEYRMKKGEDETGWAWMKSEPVFDDDGTVVRVVGFTRDITDRKARQRKLKEERQFIKQAINTLNDMFYVVDTDGTLQRWNDSLEAMVSYDDEEIARMDIVDFFPEDHRNRISDAIEEAFETGEVTVKAELRTAQDERIPYEFTGSRLTDTDDTLVGLVGVGRDISE